MSLKWQRSRQWDDRYIPAWAWPAKLILRAFSSIPLAVVLLSLVALYAVLASVPIGLLALIPTWIVYIASVVVVMAIVSAAPTFVLLSLTRRLSRVVRFPLALATFLGLGTLAVLGWIELAWPALHFDPATGGGFRLFPHFVETYRATTLRRLPGLEMSELEFYSWWPLRLILLLFVLNLVVATIRRIEFIFVNIGVLSVHTGIVLIALGSIYYASFKLEGDTLLLAGPAPDAAASAEALPEPGPPQDAFYDNTAVALWISQDRGWEQRPMRRIPRYNDYNLDAIDGELATRRFGFAGPSLPSRPALDRPVPAVAERSWLVDPDLEFRVVGYASYADLVEDWVRMTEEELSRLGEAADPNPLRELQLVLLSGDHPGAMARQSQSVVLLPNRPVARARINPFLGLEYTIGMDEQRWTDLSVELPAGARHALVVEVRPSGLAPMDRFVVAVQSGQTIELGQTGYRLTVRELAEHPPLPIITAGYEGADSSVAIVQVQPPDGPAYERWVYHRFAELNQDVLEQTSADGRPMRRDPDPTLRIAYVDASKHQFYLDERPDGSVRALYRPPGGSATVVDPVQPGSLDHLIPGLGLELGERWAHAERIERPEPVPPERRDSSQIGTHDRALLAVEVRSSEHPGWSRVVWVPFSRYLEAQQADDRAVVLPDGREVHLVFGRRRHRLPGFALRLVDFEMIAYEHRGAPRDYQSTVEVVPTDGQFEPFVHVTRLNAPLTAPFIWSEERSVLANIAGRLASGLDPRQFKFSQAGWDAEGWRQTQAMADAGELPRPFARFTILGVGNNPGIHVIALGGVLFAMGIPWAFYVKPMLLRRRKRRIQAALEASRAASSAGRAARERPEPVGVEP